MCELKLASQFHQSNILIIAHCFNRMSVSAILGSTFVLPCVERNRTRIFKDFIDTVVIPTKTIMWGGRRHYFLTALIYAHGFVKYFQLYTKRHKGQLFQVGLLSSSDFSRCPFKWLSYESCHLTGSYSFWIVCLLSAKRYWRKHFRSFHPGQDCQQPWCFCVHPVHNGPTDFFQDDTGLFKSYKWMFRTSFFQIASDFTL